MGNSRHVRKRGILLVQGALLVVVVSAVASLAVDIGIFHTAKAELQRAADAAALAGAAVLHDGGTQPQAVAEIFSYTQSNTVEGEPMPAAAVQITFGGYTNGQFVPDQTPTEAVRVRLLRTAAAGKPVRLFCSQIFGLYEIDAAGESTVRIHERQPKYNLVGIDQVSFNSLGVLAQVNGRLVSNGNVNVGYPLGLMVSVSGEARSFSGQTKVGTLAAVGGATNKLTEKLSYPSVAAPQSNNNAALGLMINALGDLNIVASISIPAGTYVVRDLTMLAGVNVRLEGPVTFYVQRNFSIGVAVNLLGNTSFDASNFKVRVLPGGCVTFLASILTPLNMDLYAPDSDVVIVTAVSSFKGRIIGKTLSINLPALGQFVEDQTLPPLDVDVPTLALVKP